MNLEKNMETSTLLQYEDPIEYDSEINNLSNIKDISSPLARKKNQFLAVDPSQNVAEILNGMFHPKLLEFQGLKYIQYVSQLDSSRDELKLLYANLKERLIERQAR